MRERHELVPSPARRTRPRALAPALLGALALALPAPSRAQVLASNPLPAATGELDRWPTIDPIDPQELELLRPLIDRGAALVTRELEGGIDARVTVYTRVRAPLATVRAVVAAPERYPEVVPALGTVEVLSRRANRAAFRFHAAASIFDVSVDATLHAVSERRVDVNITRSDFGPAGSRWELFPQADGSTITALTVWCDPSRAGWMVRQFVNNSGYVAASADITVGTILALGVKRRAEVLAGATLPPRPPRGSAPAAAPERLPYGPWMTLLHRFNVIALTLDAQGSLVQATAGQATFQGRDEILRRASSPEQWSRLWPWLRTEQVLARAPQGGRVRLSFASPLGGDGGELVAEREAGAPAVRFDGVSGGMVDDHQRVDVYDDHEHADHRFVLYSGTTEAPHAGWFHRVLMGRDVWAEAALSGYWKIVMVRYAIRDL